MGDTWPKNAENAIVKECCEVLQIKIFVSIFAAAKRGVASSKISFFMSILTIINKEARQYAECNAETDAERIRMENDFRNGAISVYRDVFNLYLHGDLSFSLGR